MRHQFMGKSLELLRPTSKRSNAGSDHHAARIELLAIHERQTKAVGILLYTGDLAAINIRHRLSLKPSAVLDKLIQRYRRGNAAAEMSAEAVQGERCLRIRNM